eukprot:CAMPEP_0119375872 /NCGR_PEP_ID=MMETSP1334-20130426/37067_1 /TAXON_ID=127549 /ORGANISM="Calcidiscus leptoporus, Strain RCC1130" /LENGTH=71 /DNA_ID=CAMNT_0007394283 /DNA_START=891 /DNA_END=1103 /DNA_ORIENTATION=-
MNVFEEAKLRRSMMGAGVAGSGNLGLVLRGSRGGHVGRQFWLCEVLAVGPREKTGSVLVGLEKRGAAAAAA